MATTPRTILHSVIMAACVLLVGSAAPAFAGQASEAIQQIHERALAVLHDEELKRPERSTDRKELLALVIAEGFSCTEMARHVLGRQWTVLDQGERTEFVQLFRLLLLKTYLHHIDRYADQSLEYLEERTARSRALVRTKLMARDRDVVLDFWLFERAGEWKVYDVGVKGMSLIQNYRGQFTRVLRNSSYPHLLERMRETACLPDCNEQTALGDHPPG